MSCRMRSDAMAFYVTPQAFSRLGEAGESLLHRLRIRMATIKSAPDIPLWTKPCAIDGMPWVFDAPIQTPAGKAAEMVYRDAGSRGVSASVAAHEKKVKQLTL
ncbi:MAG: hypothetical protein ACLTLQ_15935 [[Clostridium] scindens]